MILSSQHDPAFDRQMLGKSSLTIHGFGCYLVSIANLFQRPVQELLDVPGGITDSGMVVSDALARYCGGKYLGSTYSAPIGWCIAVTNKYASIGYPTHFFCVNMQTKQQIDPLKFPAVIEPLSYPIVEFRVFSNTTLGHALVEETTVDLAQRLKIAEEAVGRVGGLRKFMLTRVISRLKALLGVV